MWARLASAGLGVWLMAAPAVLGYGDPAAINDRIVGPLIVSFSVVAISEVTRPVRWVNLVLGAWLLIAPWLLGYVLAAAISQSIVGIAVAALAFVPGKHTERLGGGWSSLLG